ncbi:MAG: hypothetical protein PHW69_03160 [Elusimicrobiaceae bacterium]|nr:hypothetical protein [Elusimicrobiaceae bacterium]
MRKYFFAVLGLLAAGGISHGLEANWQTMNLAGGKIHMLAMDPNDNDILLAAGAQSVYRSIDAGNTWSAVLNGIKPAAVSFAPGQAGRAYANSSYAGATYRSDDSGATWVFVSSMNIPYAAVAIGMPADPADARLIYGADNETRAVYKSAGGGNGDWVSIHSLADDGSVITQLIAPSTGTVCFTVAKTGYGNSGAVYCSTDTGTTWNSTVTLSVFSLAANPGNPADLYAGGYQTVLRSTDSGATWAGIDVSGTFGPGLYDSDNDKSLFRIVVKSTGDVVACNGGTCYESVNGGLNWGTGFVIDSTLSNNSFAADGDGSLLYSAGGNTLYIADGYSGAALYKKTGSGSFETSNGGLYNVSFSGLLHDPVNSSRIYATSGADFYASTDSGTVWTQRYFDGFRAGAPDWYEAMTVDTDGTLYAGINGVVYASADAGLSWNAVYTFDTGDVGNIMSLVFDPKDLSRQTLYLGTGLGGQENIAAGLYKSIDKGGDWAQIYINGSTSTVTHIALSTTTPGLMYAASYPDYIHDENTAYLYKTINGGASWTRIEQPLDDTTGLPGGSINTLQLDPDYDGTLYAANEWNVMRSTDSGASWSRLYYDANGGIKKFLLARGADGARLMHIGLDDKIYTSINEGADWTLFGSGFNGVKTLASGSLYAGTDAGLFKSEVNASNISTTTATLLVSTGTSGATLAVNIPPAAFGSGVSVMTSLLDISTRAFAALTPTALGISVQTSISTQPAVPVTLTFNYENSDVSGLDTGQLVIVTLSTSVAAGYEVLASTAYPLLKKVVATTSHFSDFALAAYTGSGSAPAANPKAYPVPFNPMTQAGMNFINLGANSRVQIFNVVGQLIRSFEASASGTAVWDGKNSGGKTVASGVYIALLKNQAQSACRLKIAVEK